MRKKRERKEREERERKERNKEEIKGLLEEGFENWMKFKKKLIIFSSRTKTKTTEAWIDSHFQNPRPAPLFVRTSRPQEASLAYLPSISVKPQA